MSTPIFMLFENNTLLSTICPPRIYPCVTDSGSLSNDIFNLLSPNSKSNDSNHSINSGDIFMFLKDSRLKFEIVNYQLNNC